MFEYLKTKYFILKKGKQQLVDICDLVTSSDVKNTPPMIFQEFIASSAGRNIVVDVVGTKPIGFH